MDSDSDEENKISSTTPSRERTDLSHISRGGDSDAEEGGTGGKDLAKPEFEGLWDQHKPYKVPKDMESGPKLPGASKMERVSRIII